MQASRHMWTHTVMLGVKLSEIGSPKTHVNTRCEQGIISTSTSSISTTTWWVLSTQTIQRTFSLHSNEFLARKRPVIHGKLSQRVTFMMIFFLLYGTYTAHDLYLFLHKLYLCVWTVTHSHILWIPSACKITCKYVIGTALLFVTNKATTMSH